MSSSERDRVSPRISIPLDIFQSLQEEAKKINEFLTPRSLLIQSAIEFLERRRGIFQNQPPQVLEKTELKTKQVEEESAFGEFEGMLDD